MPDESYSGPNLGDAGIDALEDPNPDLSGYRIEDWATLALFWFLAVVVFLQFFTRYALNNPIAWTEEIARYLLTCVGFLGGAMAMRRQSHIQVEFFYLYLPRRAARVLSPMVDLIRFVFMAYAAWLSWKVTLIMHTQPMVVVDWPMSIVYGLCTVGIALMALWSLRVAWDNWRSGSSVLIRVKAEGRHQ